VGDNALSSGIYRRRRGEQLVSAEKTPVSTGISKRKWPKMPADTGVLNARRLPIVIENGATAHKH
jgi:hypothetical protein